jgi:hypothetical protein
VVRAVSIKHGQPKAQVKTRMAEKLLLADIVASQSRADPFVQKNRTTTMRNRGSRNKPPDSASYVFRAQQAVTCDQHFQHARYRPPTGHVTMSQERGRDECTRRRL